MDDPDIPLPSVEKVEIVSSNLQNVQTPKSEKISNVNNQRNVGVSVSGRVASNVRLDSSPSRSPSKLSRTRPSTPSSPSFSRSPSVASLRNDRSTTPRLDRKRSAPNLSVRSSTPGGQPQFRRASSNLNPSTPIRAKNMTQMTAASVAQEFLRRELAVHEKAAADVLVITHDACYGHRFSRPRASKAGLESIVERPERIQATMLGVSTAYVRLGGRHKDGKHAPHPEREPGLLPFSIIKSTRNIPLTHPAVIAVHGTKWMESLQLMCDTAEAKLAMGQKELVRPIGHTKDSKGNTLPALHSGDLYLAPESLAALQGCLGGVCDAIDTVCSPESNTRRAFVCIRPPGHHCSAEMPSGFCWLNNVHVGISYASSNHGLTHAAIIDFDLHHGDGSQTIAWAHNHDVHSNKSVKSASAYRKVPIGYYSLHDINSYPCEYGDDEKVLNASTCIHSAHGQSIWNVHLEPWRTHEEFFELYEKRYTIILEKARAFLSHHSAILRQSGIEPKAAVFLSSGFDASEWESPGMQRHQVNVPTDFYARLTADIVKLANEEGLGVDGRIISVLEGGYSDRALTSGVLSHICGLSAPSDPKTDVANDINSLSLENKLSSDRSKYDSQWWHFDQLELLEAMVAGRLPPPEKPKEKQASSYSSPTQASHARMTEVAKERQSISSQIDARLALENAPPEPVPDVDWVTAAYELSRLLIPDDRQVASCTHEELNAENSRARRERQSLSSLTTSNAAEEKMQLRDRRTRQPIAPAAQPKISTKSSNRRTTIAAASELPDPGMFEGPRTRRRSSAGSSVLSSLMDLKLDSKESEPTKSTLPSSRMASVDLGQRAPALPVKRTRAPVKKAASAANSPRKVKKSAAPLIPSIVTPETRPSTTLPAGTKDAPKTDAMDELTNGMKKISIKLKMPTEEEHKANQKRAEELNTVSSKQIRKPPLPKFARTKASAAKRVSPDTSTTISQAGGPSEERTALNDHGQGTSVGRRLSDTHLTQTREQSKSSSESIFKPDPIGSETTTDEGFVQNGSSTSQEVSRSSSIPSDAVRYPSIKLESESPPLL